jgi:hypothetical protein
MLIKGSVIYKIFVYLKIRVLGKAKHEELQHDWE